MVTSYIPSLYLIINQFKFCFCKLKILKSSSFRIFQDFGRKNCSFSYFVSIYTDSLAFLLCLMRFVFSSVKRNSLLILFMSSNSISFNSSLVSGPNKSSVFSSGLNFSSIIFISCKERRFSLFSIDLLSSIFHYRLLFFKK